MGGSCLGARGLPAARSASADDGLRLHVLDSTDPGAVLRGRARRSTSSTTLFIVSSKSGGTIETLSHFKHFYERAAATGAQFVAVTDPGSPLEELAARARLPPRVRRRPGHRRALQRAVATSGSCPAALMGVDVEALLDGAQVAEQGCAHYDDSRVELRACGSASRSASSRCTAATSSPSSSTTPIASFGLWVEQLDRRVDGQAGQGHPARWPASRSARRSVYGDDRVFVHLRNADEPDAELDDAMQRAGQGRPAGAHAPGATAPADLGRIFFFAEFATAVAGWVLGINPFDQPNVQEAKDNTDQGARGAASRRDVPEADDDGARARCSARPAPPHYVAIMGYLAPSRRVRRGDRRAARARSATATQADDDVRLRAALPALDRPAPQGRPADRALPAARARRPERRGDPGRRLHLRHAQATRRRSATCRRCATTGCPPSACALEGDPAAACATDHRAVEGDALMQIGFVGLGKMGGNMVAPHQARLRPRGRRLRLQRGRRCSAAEGTAPTAPRSLEELVAKLERAAHRLDHGPRGRPHPVDGRQARRAARRGRHDRRRRQLASGPTTRRAPSSSSRKGIALRRRRHQRRRLGPARSATA